MLPWGRRHYGPDGHSLRIFVTRSAKEGGGWTVRDVGWFLFSKRDVYELAGRAGSGPGIFVNPRVPFRHILDRAFRQKDCICERHRCATEHMWCTRNRYKYFPSARNFDGVLGRLKEVEGESRNNVQVVCEVVNYAFEISQYYNNDYYSSIICSIYYIYKRRKKKFPYFVWYIYTISRVV